MRNAGPPAVVRTEETSPAPAAKPEPSAEPARYVRAEVSGIVFEGVAFDARGYRLVVADQPQGPGSRFADAAAAGSALGGRAAVNAGFFTPEGNPLGLVVAGGKPAASWNSTSSLGSGVWHVDASGKSGITRRENIGRAAALAARELIQAGPMLVDHGEVVPGLDATKPAVRSFILWDGGNRWWIGRSSACTLAELAKAVRSNPAGWPVKHALNLDGGRSSDLWISPQIPGGPIVRRAPWNRPVRNFLVLAPR